MELNEYPTKVGSEIGVSDWMEIDQFRIGIFAECTDDRQWIHVNPERAARESPFGAPVAHGFLTLSLLTHFHEQAEILPKDASSVINYGIDSARFLSPVKSGAQIRNRAVLLGIEKKSDVAWRMSLKNTIEVKGSDKPALIAESILMIVKE